MATDTKTKEEPQTLAGRLHERAVKRIEKNVDNQVDSKLQQGQTPSDILNSLLNSIGPSKQDQAQRINNDLMPQINQIASQRVAVPGRENFGARLLSTMATNDPTNLFGSKTKPLGFENATQLLQLQQSLDKNAMDGPKNQTEVVKNLVDIAKNTGNRDLMAALTGQKSPDGTIQTDPMTGKPTEKGIHQEETVKANVDLLKASRKDLQDFTVKSTPLITNFMKLQDIAEKMKDYKPGLLEQIYAKGDTIAGKFAGDSNITRYNAVLNRMLGQLAKVSGDSGNIADQEQARQLEAAGKTSLPLKTKIELINDTFDNIFANLDTRKELAKMPGYEKRFPLFQQARERHAKNKELLASSGSKKKQLTVDNLFEGLQ